MLSHRETQIVRGMLRRGDRQHDIAAYFGVNGGRIGEVATLKDAYPNAQPLEENQLPPAGPYITKYALESVIRTLNEAIEAIEMAEVEEEISNVRAALILAKESLQQKIMDLEEA